MPDRKPYAEQCTRVYTRTGTRAHLLSPVQTIRNGSVLCDRVLPEWFTEWHGTGSQAETERAASLPLCRYCEDQARREDAYYSEPPQFSQDPAAEHAPVARRAARPGGAAPSSPGAAGKTPDPASSPNPLQGPVSTSPRGPVKAVAGTGAGSGTGRGATGAAESPLPAGSSGEEWRKRVKAATSALHAQQRRRAARPVPRAKRGAGASYRPGMAVRKPPGGGEAS